MIVTFKGRMPHYARVKEVLKPIKAPVTWGSVAIPGRAGVILTDKTVEPISIPVVFLIEGEDREEYERNKEDFALWLDCEKAEELIFSDNPNRSYYAVPSGAVIPDDELVIFSLVKVDFFIPFPYKYAPAKSSPFVTGVARIYNKGTRPVKPNIFALVKRDITYMDVMGAEKYMRIGQPAGLNEVTFEAETLAYHNLMNTLTGWSATGTTIDGGQVTGGFGATGTEFTTNTWGTPTSGYSGPALKQAIVGQALSDWKVEALVRLQTNTVNGVKIFGRVEIYLLDAMNQSIGKLAMKMVGNTPGNFGEARVGGGAKYVYPIARTGGPKGTEWNNFDGILRLQKRGNVFDMYIAQIHPTSGQHLYPVSARYVDEDFEFTEQLSQIQVHIGKPYNQGGVLSTGIKDIKVWKLNTPVDNNPSVIARNGDIIELDFDNSAIYVNGEERRELKDIGASFFNVPRGTHELAIHPPDAFDAVATIREVYQ